MKFKVGDKVKIVPIEPNPPLGIEGHFDSHDYDYISEMGIITYIFLPTHYPYEVHFLEFVGIYSECNLIKYTRTLNDLVQKES